MRILYFASLLLIAVPVYAEECNWRWFMAHGFPNEPQWEVSQGCADVRRDGAKIKARLFGPRPERSAAEATPTEPQDASEYQGVEQVAEVEGSVGRDWRAKMIYQRWGTDEYGLNLMGDYFSHKYQGEGYEAFTLHATGVMVIGLRRDLSKSANPLFQRTSASRRH